MIDPSTNPGSEEHDSIERYDLEVAPRVRNLPPYLFGRLNELKYRKRREGIDVIDLGMGNPTDPPEEWVVDKLCEAARDSRNHRYSVATGVYNLRREVAQRYQARFGVGLDPDREVVATIGSKEGFSHMCLALLGPGDTALVPAPSFPVHIHAIALASANVISLDVRDPAAFLANVARTCESLFPRPKILVLNYPHNPTATVVEPAFFEEVVALARRYRFFVIHDFAYGDLGFDGYQPPSFLSVKGAKGVGCEFTTMSKGYNMAGWRVGFAAGNPDMLAALKAIKGYYDYGIFQAVQVASIVALRHGEESRLAQVAEYQHRRETLVRGLRRIGWEVETPRAGMFVWTAIPQPWRSRIGSIDFAMELLEQANVVVSPGRGFGETGEGYLRLALVENAHRLQQAVRQVGRYLRSANAILSPSPAPPG
jgi:alanine-synthesizing transaminase